MFREKDGPRWKASTRKNYGKGHGGEAHFRALDKKTGKELGKVDLPARTNTAPMTYMHDGHQYIVVAVASPSLPAELVGLALPDARPPRVAPPPDHPSERLPGKPETTPGRQRSSPN
jgi:hypothetical protein